MLFSSREGRVVMDNAARRKRHLSPPVDPYAPTSPDYAKRSAVTRVDLGGGMIREDIGEPTTGGYPPAKAGRHK
ncbi:MAG: hypothetical protein SFV20_06900 [Sphingopyxis sp.]|nr:hypothetical protein [Sphingopyxis sp.]